jgi:hypothetical protein
MPVIGTDAALVKIVDNATRGGQVASNVYWYRSPIDPADADLENLADQFEADVLVDLADLQSAGWVHSTISVDCVNGPYAPYERDSGVGAGAVSGSAMPVYSSFPVRLIRTFRETRNGYKRIPGVTEEMITGDGFESAVQTAWEAFVPALAATLETTDLAVWTPCIVRRSFQGVLLEPEEYLYNPVTEAIFLNRVTTQRSRLLW